MASVPDKTSSLYAVSRGQIENNNLSIGLRLIWLNNCLAFMFGIYAAVTLFRSPAPELFVRAQKLSMLIPYIGVGVSLFTLFDIITGIIRIGQIRTNYEKENPADLPGIPAVDGSLTDRILQRLSPVAQALLFLVIWTYLVLYDKHLL